VVEKFEGVPGRDAFFATKRGASSAGGGTRGRRPAGVNLPRPAGEAKAAICGENVGVERLVASWAFLARTAAVSETILVLAFDLRPAVGGFADDETVFATTRAQRARICPFRQTRDRNLCHPIPPSNHVSEKDQPST